jgi:hypothetical protein
MLQPQTKNNSFSFARHFDILWQKNNWNENLVLGIELLVLHSRYLLENKGCFISSYFFFFASRIIS